MRKSFLSLSCLILGIVSALTGPVSRSRAEYPAKQFNNKRCSSSASLKCLPTRKGGQAAACGIEKMLPSYPGSGVTTSRAKACISHE